METTQTSWKEARLPFVEMRFTLHSAESYKPHSHQEFCVGGVTEGTTLTRIRERMYAVSPGSLVVIGPEEVHCSNPPKDTVRSKITAYFDVEWCCSIQEALFGRCGRFVPSHTPLLESRMLFDALLHLADLVRSDTLPLEKSERLAQFGADLFIRCCDATFARGEAEQWGVIQEVKNYLRQQAELDITLEELAALFSCNPYHLLRSFKKMAGLPPHAFLLSARIERAKKLLLDGASLAAVAAETGFADEGFFHRTFRRIVAATPADYQQGTIPPAKNL